MKFIQQTALQKSTSMFNVNSACIQSSATVDRTDTMDTGRVIVWALTPHFLTVGCWNVHPHF